MPSLTPYEYGLISNMTAQDIVWFMIVCYILTSIGLAIRYFVRKFENDR